MPNLLPLATSDAGRTANALALNTAPDDGFDLKSLRRFTSVPEHPDFGIVALRGMVIIYDEAALHREDVIEGAYYVRESQRPHSMLAWEKWLQREWEKRTRRAGPAGPLQTRREVVQAVRWPRGEHLALRLASGFTDGPYKDRWFGVDLIGKVIGIYLPTNSEGER